jgi:uncharacterized protein YsxB (DUF464 family)|tara:strand:+ start:612 stop:863 length:252 start_codon:yes stop_codon:yes gene_type:complete
MSGEGEYLRKEWREKELLIHKTKVVSEINSLKIKLDEMKSQNEKIILLLESFISAKKTLEEDVKETVKVPKDDRYVLTGWFFT